MVFTIGPSRNTCLKVKKFKLHIWAYFKYFLNLILFVGIHKIHISYYDVFLTVHHSIDFFKLPN